jgi:SAM-dependent methyltransferase
MLPKFTYRSKEKELLDASDIPVELLNKNLGELDRFNRISGGHFISLKGIKRLITNHDKIYHVVDLGCGSGDTLRIVAEWCRSENFKIKLTGVDMNPDAIDYLKIHCANYPEITGITEDYKSYLNRTQSIDIIHCSLFCHHLDDFELERLFKYFAQYVKTGFVINDLRRQRFAYYSVWLLTRILNGTVLAKNDGPVSVLRGFKSEELALLFAKANISNYSIKKMWGFRFLVTGLTENHES